ncbi:MAG: hypothetical protein JSU05_12525, partial [Bacteroidetes bacterium]|nr:hypothetical protein [Bacteroidota bacterium]
NQNEKTNAVGFSTVYGAWFPYLSAGLEYTFDRQALLNNNTTLRFSQLDARAGLSIPLSWAKGKTFNNFSIGTSYYLQTQFYKNYSTSSASFSYLYHYINWSQQSQMARQQIFPRTAYSISLNHRYPITRYKGYQFLGNASVYLPGIANTHTIVVNGAFQQRDTTYTLFSNLFANARGYSDVYLSRMWKLSGNYHFPIFIPDWGFGNILYLQRIRGNVFYDFTKVYSKDKTLTRNQRSVGGEIYIDTKWWNQYPLTFGFRVSHLLDNDLVTGGKGMVYEFILPVSILPK